MIIVALLLESIPAAYCRGILSVEIAHAKLAILKLNNVC